MRDGRPVTVEVSADGVGLVSHAGSALLAQTADRLGLTKALSLRLGAIKQRRRGHDPGRVICDLVVMLADGGECVADLGGVRDQEALFGPVASDSTAFRVIDRVAADLTLLDALRAAHARARERFWELHGTPERLTIDVDATLVTAHAEKEQAAGNYKGGYGFHPLQAYADETREALGGLLRPGNAGANTAADHVTVLDRALEQIPAEHVERIEILVRADSAGATHGSVDYCREANMRFSVGYELTEPVRAAILQIPADAWVSALDQDGSERNNGEVAEITETLQLGSWPQGSRVIVRRERRGPHPRRQGHRPCEVPVQGVRAQRGVATARHARARPARLDPGAAARRRARQGPAQTAAPSTAARRRPARVSRTTRQAAPPARLAMATQLLAAFQKLKTLPAITG
jgi:hypothetical protein